MTLAEDVNLEEFVMTKDEFSGADIKAICTEAGLLALRERRMKVLFLSLNTLFFFRSHLKQDATV
jgi:26S proteasome regulatory subunit T2